MESDQNNINLTASELSQLWSAYMNSSMSKCLFIYFLETVEDNQIRLIIEKGLEISNSHLDKLTSFFQKDGYPIPYGFKVEEDVYLSAPRLFSDSFVLYFTQSMGAIALNFYALSKSLSARADIEAYFSKCIFEINHHESMSRKVLLSKGLFIRSPYLIPQKEVNFVKSQKFMSDWFEKKRPLSAIEITNIFSNYQRNALGRASMMGFSQVAQSKEVREYFVRGKEIAFKHTKIFATHLEECDLPAPTSWDTEITDSQTAPFSDKLMMFMTTSLIALSIGFYATSMATSARKDLALDYVRLSAEIAEFAEDGGNILIDNGWLEEPPLSADRDKLINR